MFNPSDTIVALATPPGGWRQIIRIAGPEALACCEAVCQHPLASAPPGILPVELILTPELKLPAQLYLYRAPHSYSGEDLVEIHLTAASVVVECLLERLLSSLNTRGAGPGEFTARAYLNGKLDLAQAEAVYEIIHSTNRVQLDAAQTLLRGHLGDAVKRTQEAILDCLGRLEAGLDFSQEDIEIIRTEEAIQRLDRIRADLQEVDRRGLHDRETLHLPSVGIAGAPNAGKSSLFNALLGRTRSLVSHTQRTTRDVLAARLPLAHGACLLFDCAGLLPQPESLIDRLAQQAALESLHGAKHVLFCVDASAPEDARALLDSCQIQSDNLLLLGTKSDRIDTNLADRQAALERRFGQPCLMVSAHTGSNLDVLARRLDSLLHRTGDVSNGESLMSLTARHRQGLSLALEHLDQAMEALQHEQTEVAALLLRAAYQHLGETTQHLDEKILGRIFAHFCIGK